MPNVSTVVSVQSLFLIAVERFGAVVFPLRSPVISRKLRTFLVLGSWLVSAAICSPFLFTLKLVEKAEKPECVVSSTEAFGDSSSFADYVLSLYVVIIFIPLSLLTLLYSVVLYKLKPQRFPGEHSHSRGISFYLFIVISSFMAQANCVINPWICFICSAKYRQGLKELSPKSCNLEKVSS